MENLIEEWREIRDWEGLYEVSSLGRVRSVPREHVRLGKGGKPTVFRYGYKLLRPGERHHGYLQVVLSDMVNNRQKIAKVHRLVCEAFHGPQPGWDYEVAHKDHNPKNNKADNLHWATHKANIQDSASVGRIGGRSRVANNNSGVVGVTWEKTRRRWMAQFCGRHLGQFKDFEEAVAARQRAEQAHREQSDGVEDLPSAA